MYEKREIATNTFAFRFEKPQEFSFHAGQYISLCVDTPEIAMPSGTMREFSLASAPYEDVLTLAWRHRDTPAKQQFQDIDIGGTAYLQGPFGHFHLKEGKVPIVMLAGGIGIVPLLSMLKQALHEKRQNTILIIFSNRFLRDIPFLAELKTLATSPQITLVNTLTRIPETSWTEEVGYVTHDMIRKYIFEPIHAEYYISGPQRFVGGMWEVLDELGIETSHIHGEEFTGYES